MEAELDRELYEAACQAREKAYAPYSHFAVGAAVRAADGRILPAATSKMLPMA